MPEKVTPEVKTCLFAEEIRQEKSNKYIILGVFNGIVKISDLPAKIPLALYMEFFPVPSGELEIGIRLSGPGEDRVEMRVKANVHDPSRPLVIPSPRMEVALEKEGELLLEVQFDNGEYQSVDKVLIQKDSSIIRFPYANVESGHTE